MGRSRARFSQRVKRVANPDANLLGLPVEVRTKIYEYVFADLIAQLPEKLFAVFAICGHTYDITATLKKKCKTRRNDCPRLQFQAKCPGHRAELRLSQPQFWEDHGLRRLLDYIGQHPEYLFPPGMAVHAKEGERLLKTGITSLLLTNRQIYEEAFEALCAQTEFVVNISGGDSPQDEAAVRFDDGCPHLAFAKLLKVNIRADSNETIKKIMRRLGRLLAAILAGGRLRSLHLFFEGTSSVDQRGIVHLLKLVEQKLGEPLKQRRCSVKVYLGEASKELVGSERVLAFANTLQGDYLGDGYYALQPHISDNCIDTMNTMTDEAHAQKRAFCLHCNKDACADNIQRMKNHLLKCEPYLNSNGGEPSFAFELDGPIAPDTPLSGIPGPPAVPGSGNGGEGSSQQDTSVAGTPGMGPPTANMGSGTPVTPSAAMVKASQDSLNKVRTAMARSTKRLESLESVLKTQIQDGMHNAATHVRAAIRDERDRLFKLSQTLVKQEMKVRDAQAAIGVPM